MQHLPTVTAHANINPRDAFLQKLDKEADLPATGGVVARVIQLASSEDYAVQDLTYFVLANAGLTQKILKLANTVQYHVAAKGKITTVSRAIFLLGFETVKTTALTMLLIEGLSSLIHSHAVRTELKRAMYASIIGREMARSSKRPGAEEAAIAALFANVGQVMVAAYDYPSYVKVCELGKSEPMSEEQAAIQVLGFGYGALSQSILRRWNIPDMITRAVIPLSASILKPAKNSQDWAQQIASFSVEATNLIAYRSRERFPQTESILLARYGMALNLDNDKLEELQRSVATEFAELCKIMDLGGVEASQDDNVPSNEGQGIPIQFLMNQDNGLVAQQEKKRYPSGKPLHAKELLLEGVQQIMQMSAISQPKVNDLMLLVLETLFNSMGFRFAAICLKDRKENTFRARLALGEDLQRRNSGFVFAPGGKKDLFVLAMESDSDLMISDATDMEIQALLPVWHRKLLPDAKSFMILPITVNQKTLGFFYGDRALPAPEGVPADEAALIKILKTQMSSMLSNRHTSLD